MKEIGSWRRKTCSWPRNSLSLRENEFVVKLESFSWNCAGLDVSAVIETLLTFHSSSFRLIRTCFKGCKIRNLLLKKYQQVFISMTPRPLNLPPTQQHCFQIGNTKIQPLNPNAKKSAECSPSQKKVFRKRKKTRNAFFGWCLWIFMVGIYSMKTHGNIQDRITSWSVRVKLIQRVPNTSPRVLPGTPQ